MKRLESAVAEARAAFAESQKWDKKWHRTGCNFHPVEDSRKAYERKRGVAHKILTAIIEEGA